MYAIVKTGGKQYKVSPGDTITVDKIEGEIGDSIVFDNVLMLVDDVNNVQVGKPLIADKKISGQIVRHKKGKKIIVFKAKRRKGYRTKSGHRQLLTDVTIKDFKE